MLNLDKINEVINECSNMTGNDTVKVVNICELFEKIWPDYFTNFALWAERENEFCTVIREGINKKAFNYYAEEKHCFSIYTAISETKKKGLSIVIVENMS